MKWNKLNSLYTEEEQLAGGLADGKTLADIAGKHGRPIAHIQSQYKQGMPVEREHTDDKKKASEIVRDHLCEDPDYYTKLREMESSNKSEKSEE